MACRGELSPKWWQDKDLLAAEIAVHGSNAALVKAHGHNESMYRKWRKVHGLLPSEPPTKAFEVPVEGMSAPISELERVRQENAELRRYVKRDRQGDISEARVIDALLAAIPAASPRYKPPAAKRSKREPHSMAVLFSDVHASEVVRAEETLGINAYDWDIMLKRMARMQNSILAHQEHLAAPVDELNVWILGDQLSGDIHDELARTNDRPTAQAAVDFGYETARWLEEFVPHFKRINVVGVPGNHPRFTVKPANKQAHNNADWICYQVTQALLREHPSFTWHFPRAAYATTMVAKRWHVLLLHGDGIRTTMPGVPWGGVVRRITSLEQQFNKAKKPIDYFCLGHFHAANALDGIGSKVFMNGSLKGVDEFSLKQFGSGHHPSQLLLTFHEKHGITGTQYLDLEDVEPAGLAA